MILKMTYKKEKTATFIVIQDEYVSEDENYLYLQCGKYLKKNIVNLVEVKSKTENSNSDLTDDA